MPTTSWISGTRVLAAACLLVCGNCLAQTSTPLLDEVHTVAASTTGVPVEETFNITATGIYQVTLTDLGAQLSPAAPLASVKLAITGGSTLVNLTAASGSTVTGNTQLTAAGSATFTAQPGTYVIHVVGAPSKKSDGSVVAGSGAIGMAITNTGDGSQVAAFSDILALPSGGTLTNVGALNDSFTVATAGNYQVTLTDMQLPTQLTTLTLAIVVQGGSLVTDPAFATAPGTPVATTTVALQSGVTYRIFAGGQAGGTVNAGLYGVNVSPAGGGAPVYSQSVPVGVVALVGTPALTAGSYTLSFTDLAYPNPLSPTGVAATLNGQAVAQLTAGGNRTFAATSSTYQVFALGLPQAPAATGSYSVTLTPQNGPAALSVARAVSASGSSVSAYSFDTPVVTAGTYALDLADLGLPAQFISLSAAAFQNGHILGSALSSTGSMTTTPAAGPVSLLVFAQPGTGGSLFGIDLTASGSTSPLFATTQGVGQLFGGSTITVTSAGSYTVTVGDVGFPTALASLAVAVTQGANNLGEIFTGGTFSFTASPGTYFVNLIAQPGTTTSDHAGTYSVSVAPTPPAPVVVLQSSAASVTSGGTVTLTWSSQNATACSGSSTPSGVWNTSQLTGNAQPTGSITTSTTFTLKCTGAGGSTTQTASVSISSPASKGGGGAVSLDIVAVLSALTLARLGTSTGGTRL
ncbi:MAG: beta strand repeat-containing protein [Steroidobacteraceae bacterium]